MNKATKVLLIIAACLVFVGASAFCVTMAANDWDFSKVGNRREGVTYNVEGEFKDISVDSETEDIKFVRSSDGRCRVECVEGEREKHDVFVKDGTLYIREDDMRKWYDHISFFSFGKRSITVYLPETELGSLRIDESTGDISIPSEFSFEDVDMTLSTGDVDLKASSAGRLKIGTSTGDIRIEGTSSDEIDLKVSTGRIDVIDTDCKGDVRFTVSTGRANFNGVTCGGIVSDGSTGSVTLEAVNVSGKVYIERSTGDVKFERSDAAEVEIETDTGDVTGTLLTDKIFIVRSDTGSIDVPETTTGGKFKVTTDTGDIEIGIVR